MVQAELHILVLLAQQGDEKALLCLFNNLQPMAIQFAFKLIGEQSLAQDATQNAWLKVVANLVNLKNPEVFKSWLFRAVRWACLDILRQQQTDKQNISDTPVEDVTDLQVDVNEEVIQAMKTLPDEENQAIYLFYFVQLSLVEIALIQEVPVGTVKTRLFRAKAKLKLQLENIA